jgi:hypothetical protein
VNKRAISQYNYVVSFITLELKILIFYWLIIDIMNWVYYCYLLSGHKLPVQHVAAHLEVHWIVLLCAVSRRLIYVISWFYSSQRSRSCLYIVCILLYSNVRRVNKINKSYLKHVCKTKCSLNTCCIGLAMTNHIT